jgi:hypothetical protein
MRSTTSDGKTLRKKGLVRVLFLLHKDLMTKRFEATYSVGEERMTLIFSAGTYEALPFEVRLMGPWYGCLYIDGERLKLAQRDEIARQGYTILREPLEHMLDAA